MLWTLYNQEMAEGFELHLSSLNFIGSSLAYDFIANRITNLFLCVYRFLSINN